MVLPRDLPALALAAALLLPAVGAVPTLLSADEAARGPVALPCSLPAALCALLAPLCPPLGLFCPPPPPAFVDIFGEFPCDAQSCGYTPATLTIPVGASVVWTNTATITHTASSDLNLWDTGFLGQGESSDPIAFLVAGTFGYHCGIHGSMAGTVVVVG